MKEIKQAAPTSSRRPSKQRQEEEQRVAALMHQQNELKKEIEHLTNGAASSDSGTSAEAKPAAPVPSLGLEPPKQLTEAAQADADLNDVFDVYCSPPGEMDAVNFKKFMRETYTLTKK